MDRTDIEKLSQNITDSEKALLKGINSDNIKERVGSIDLGMAAQKMREMGLNEAADKLGSMTNSDIINQISKNPEIIDKMKKIFK